MLDVSGWHLPFADMAELLPRFGGRAELELAVDDVASWHFAVADMFVLVLFSVVNRRLLAGGSCLLSVASSHALFFRMWYFAAHAVGGHSNRPCGNALVPNTFLYM